MEYPENFVAAALIVVVYLFLPVHTGGGLARPLFYDAVAQNLPLCVLSMFVSEGDNALNAVELGVWDVGGAVRGE